MGKESHGAKSMWPAYFPRRVCLPEGRVGGLMGGKEEYWGSQGRSQCANSTGYSRSAGWKLSTRGQDEVRKI